jgi:ABC-type multidrug transport system ATPase subunit
MTVEEHIDYYARIKGISRNEKGALVEDVIKELGLESHRKKEAGTLSGGNKRKLSVAIAIIGNP